MQPALAAGLPEITKNQTRRIIVMVGEIANILARQRAERVESCSSVFHSQVQWIRHYNRDWHTTPHKGWTS
jgi:hypothetical protein